MEDSARGDVKESVVDDVGQQVAETPSTSHEVAGTPGMSQEVSETPISSVHFCLSCILDWLFCVRSCS